MADKIVSKWSYKSTDDLHKILKDWHSDTESAAKKRKEADTEIQKFRRQYKQKAYGLLGDEYKFNADKRYEDSESLLNNMVLNAAEKRDGKDAADAMKKSPEMIRAYAKEVLGVQYEQVHQQMAEAEGEQLEQLLDNLSNELAQNSSTKLKDVNEATTQLIRNPKHYEKNKQVLGQIVGSSVKPDTPQYAVVNHIKSGYQGNMNADYKTRYKGKHWG